MFEFKSGSCSDLSIPVWVFEFLNHFGFGQIRTIGQPGSNNRTIRFMCNFGPNSLEKFINTTSDIGLGC